MLDFSISQNFLVGRDKQCQVRIADLSVAKMQSLIMYTDNKVFIRDLNSQYGTFVRQEQLLLIDYEKYYSRETAVPMIVHDMIISFWVEPRFTPM